jgi:pimeloyl-ACP methyl ester carboxylesterase
VSAFQNATIVVIHGAWADGSSWDPVIRRLQSEGVNVVAAPIPLTSLGDDAAALRRKIARTGGLVIVAGHAYAGAVVGTAHDERVKALVYIAALAPDEGETVAEVFYRDEPHPQPRSLHPMGTDSSGCPMRALPKPSRRTQRQSKSRSAAPSSGPSR